MVGARTFVGICQYDESFVIDLVSDEEGAVCLPPSVVVVASRVFVGYSQAEAVVIFTFSAFGATWHEGFVLDRVRD